MALKFGTAFLLVLLLQGCASSSVFNAYPHQAAEFRAAIANQTIAEQVAKLSEKEQSQDGLLYAQERGRLNQLNQQFSASKSDFEQVYQRYQAIEDKAKIDASDWLASGSALLTNDNAIAYQGYGYEQILAIQFQAINYLALGDIAGASVELRRAALVQRQLELANEKLIEKAKEKAKKEAIDLSSWQKAPELQNVQALAGSVKSSFQNAYTFYMSALIWEALGNSNDALVDYKKALEINPQNSTILADVKRLQSHKKLSTDSAYLVVLYEDGFINERQSFTLNIPYFTSDSVTYLNVAFPYYKTPAPAQFLTVSTAIQTLGQTQVIANIDAMAAKALSEKIPAMIVRMVLRALAKHTIHQQSTKQAGLLGSLIATLYNLVSEQADRRNWLTLPANVQLLRVPIASGSQSINLSLAGLKKSVTVNSQAGRVTLLRVIDGQSHLITQQFQL